MNTSYVGAFAIGVAIVIFMMSIRFRRSPLARPIRILSIAVLLNALNPLIGKGYAESPMRERIQVGCSALSIVLMVFFVVEMLRFRARKRGKA